jgi:hypothetical protein
MLLVDTSEAYLYAKYKWLFSSRCSQEELADFNKTNIEHYGKSDELNKINWLSFSDLSVNEDIMDFRKSSSVTALLCPRYHYTNEHNSVRYIGNSLIAVMADFEYASVLCQCGTVGFGVTDKKKPCSKWKYCDRCANKKRQYYYLKYSSAYNPLKSSYFITLTLDSPDKVRFIQGNYDQVIHAWNKLNGYVDAMYSNNLITGGLRAEELSIDRLYPESIVNPHLHVICEGIEGLTSHTFEGIKIDVIEIKTQDHWDNTIYYIYKSMNLYSAYANDWTKENGSTVNRNLRNTLEHHAYVIKNRNQTRAFGTFHSKSKSCTSESIKNITRSKKDISLQTEAKKINYTVEEPMYEDFKKGVEDTLNITITHDPLLKLAYAELSLPEEKKKERPWYKNPWILGGGALAGAGALYGAGKLYNSGDNMVNNTFGAGVDKYVVNPIKGLFNNNPAPTAQPSTPTTPTPSTPTTPSAPEPTKPLAYLKGHGPLKADTLAINGIDDSDLTARKAYLSGSLNHMEMNAYKQKTMLQDALDNPIGTEHEFSDPAMLENKLKEYNDGLPLKTLNDEQLTAYATPPERNSVTSPDWSYRDILPENDLASGLQNGRLTRNDYRNFVQTAQKPVSPTEEAMYFTGDVGQKAMYGQIGADVLSAAAPSSKLLGATSTGLGHLNAGLSPIFGGLTGQHLGQAVGGNVPGTNIPMEYAGAAGGTAVGMVPLANRLAPKVLARLIPQIAPRLAAGAAGGPAGEIAAMASLLGGMGVDVYTSAKNNALNQQMGNNAHIGRLGTLFTNAFNSLNNNKDAIPLKGLMMTPAWQEVVSNPGKYSNILGPELISAMVNTSKSGITGIAGRKLKELISH